MLEFYLYCAYWNKSDIRNQQSMVYCRKISLTLSENYEVKTERLEVSESGEDANFIQELWPLVIEILLDFENVNSNRQINLKAGVYSDEQIRREIGY